MLPLLFLVFLADPPVEPSGKAELRLVFSTKTFDPLKPGKETVKGVIVNNTGKPIQVPTVYEGRAMEIVALPRGKGFGRWEMSLFRRADVVQKWANLKPGGRKVLFEMKLSEVLRTNRIGGPRYGWTWIARPTPPASPAVDGRGNVMPGKVKFVLRLNHKGLKAVSPPVELEFAVGKKK